MREKMQVLLKQKPIIGIVALVCTIIFVLASTLAWFSATDARDNNFSAKVEFKVDVVDEFDPPGSIVPGQSIGKKVSAKNTGNIDAFVRVMAFPVASKDNTPLQISEGVEVTYENLNTTNWKDGGDGYYYYLGILEPGAEAEPLFTGVNLTLDDAATETYQAATFDIVVKTEAADGRNNEYRLSWWGSNDPQAADPLKTIDTTLQTALGR